MAEAERVEQVLDFLCLLDQMKSIERSAWIGDRSRHENDAEHSWHLAMYCLLFHRELAVEVNLGRVLELVLCHDLVEILAGDVNVYDTAARAAQAAREEDAAQELFGQLPADLGQFVEQCWREFEAGQTAEACYARAMDRLQAIAQNCVSGGRAWRDRQVTEALSREVNGPYLAACAPALEIFEALAARARRDRLWADLQDEDGATRP